MMDESNLQALIDAGAAIGESKTVDPTADYAVVPEGYNLEDLEQYHENPRRARGSITTFDVASFNSYMKTYKGVASAIFANPLAVTAIGIIDYHTPETPAFCDHRITYVAPRSKEWTVWMAHNCKAMSQYDFAQFIEEHVDDIRNPAGADVLTIARDLEVTKGVNFKSKVDLINGARVFHCAEAINSQSGTGSVKVPEQFTVGIPIFAGDEKATPLVAKLRYRLRDGGQLSLWYELQKPEKAEEKAFLDIVKAMHNATGIAPWMGKP